MPQPSFVLASGQAIAKFGGLPLPTTGVVMSQIDLNDGVNWMLRDVEFLIDRHFTIAPLSWRFRSVYTADDRYAGTLHLLSAYSERNSVPLSQAKAAITQAGEQYLTFDLLTQIQARLKNLTAKPAKPSIPLLWYCDLEFACRIPFAADITPTTGSHAANGGSGQTNPFTITYAGSVFSEPVFTYTCTNGAGVTTALLNITNTLSQESCLITFTPILAGSTSWTIVVDCARWKVTDQAGKEYDITGSFPMLYGPPGTANPFTCQLSCSAATSGTLAWSYANRWEL